jgi:hypothetical protein
VNDVYQAFCKENQNIEISRSKFAKLRPTHVKKKHQIPKNECICNTCGNIDLCIKSLIDAGVIQSDHLDKDLVTKTTMCEPLEGFKHPPLDCVLRKCSKCGVDNLDELLNVNKGMENKNINLYRWENVTVPVDSKEGDTKESQTKAELKEKENVKKGRNTKRSKKKQEAKVEEMKPGCSGGKSKSDGEKVKQKKVMMLVDVRCTIRECINILKDSLQSYSQHIFNARWSVSQFRKVIENIPDDTMVWIEDFAQNYATWYQDEAQGAHWHHNLVTIHPIVTYRKCDRTLCREKECGESVREEYVAVSNDLVHDFAAVAAFEAAMEENMENRGIFSGKERLIIFSDGASSQYKSKKPFFSLSQRKSKSTRCFFGSGHGKSICDVISGVVKHHLHESVKSRDKVIDNAKAAYHLLKETCKPTKVDPHISRHFLYVDKNKIKRPPFKQDLKAIPGTMTFHQVQNNGQDGIIQARTIACFCDFCEGEGEICENAAYTSNFVSYNLKTGKKIQEGKETHKGKKKIC